MPVREKSSGNGSVVVAKDDVTVPPGVNGTAPGAQGEGEEGGEGEKAKKLKKEKPAVVYADPIQPLTRVVYPQVSVCICATPEQHGVSEEQIQKITEAFQAVGLDGLISYAPPLTAVDAMGLIGWEVEQKDGPKFGEDYSLTDFYDKKVRLHKNFKNRPIYKNNLETIQQNILMGRWQLNGEPTIITDEGNVADNQHTLISLIIAQQRLDYEKQTDQSTLKWLDKWPSGVISIPKVIVYGIKGTEEVINSMNTGKPRNFTDVLFRSPYFANLPLRSKDGVDRQTAARVTDHAVREIWTRMWMYLNSYGNRLTNMEGANWIEKHGGTDGKFLECVRFILDEDTHGHISNYLSCGKAVAMMWLGATGKSNQEKYYVLRNNDKDDEAYMTVNWANENLAKSFWKEFGDREPDKIVHLGKENETTVRGKARGPLKALTDLLEKANDSGEPMIYEKDFMIARAWNLWCEEKPITEASVKIRDTDYTEADKSTGVRTLVKKKHLRFGNLDLGIYREKLTPQITHQQQAEADSRIKELKDKTVQERGESGVGEDDESSEGTTEQLKGVKSQAQKDCEALQIANPDVQVVLVKTVSGKCQLWGAGVKEVSKLMDVEPQTHPNDSQYCTFDVADWEKLCDKVNGAGYAIGLGDRVDGQLQIVMSAKPSKNGGGAGQRKK